MLHWATLNLSKPTKDDEAASITSGTSAGFSTSDLGLNDQSLSLLQGVELDCLRLQVFLAQRADEVSVAPLSGQYKAPLAMLAKYCEALLSHCQMALSSKSACSRNPADVTIASGSICPVRAC